MGILLAFAPFIVFAIADRVAGSEIALLAGAAASAILLLRELVSPGRTPKLLEVGTFILFGGLALYARLAAPTWSLIAVRLRGRCRSLHHHSVFPGDSPPFHAAICA